MTDYNSVWNVDFDNLKKDISEFVQFDDDRKKAEGIYRDKVLANFKTIKDPILAMMYFLTVVAVAQNSDASLTGLNDDKTCILGKRLKVASDLSQLTNDLQNLTTNETVTDVDANGVLKNYASDLNQLLDEFKDPDFKKCFSSISDMSSALETNFKDLRRLVYAHDGSGYDPDPNLNMGDTYYFDTMGGGKFISFKEMIDAMGKKGNTDATAADKALTDSFSSASSSSGGINAAINEEVSLNTNYQKSLQAFVAQLMKDTKDVSQAAVSNQKVG